MEAVTISGLETDYSLESLLEKEYFDKFSHSIMKMSEGVVRATGKDYNVCHFGRKKDLFTETDVLRCIPGLTHADGHKLRSFAKEKLVSFNEYLSLVISVIKDFEEEEEGFTEGRNITSTIGICVYQDELYSFRTMRDGGKWYMYCDPAVRGGAYHTTRYILLAVNE